MPSHPEKEKRIIIEGTTHSGEKFRPSDWAERMCGCLASFNNRRIAYSPQLRPIVRQNSNTKCLVVDPRLAETNPDVFQCVMNFANENCLKIYESYESAE